MKLIKYLEDAIEEEIEGVKGYAKKAVELKDEHPNLAQVLYNISVQEDAHQAALHKEAVKVIEDYQRNHGEPPAAMMAVYEYVHQKHIDALADARRYQDVYKSS
jgi:rubrerythrin